MESPTVTADPSKISAVESKCITISPAAPCALESENQPAPWSLTTCVALLMLVVVWGAKVYSTWAAWGNLTIDSGHEMYVPALLAEGKQLYRDTFYSFGPPAPYFNAYLFRLFGINLNVLYWAGSLSALGSAIFLYLAGMRLSSWVVGWTAGAVVLLEAFQPSLFCFPLPYSFAAVYGCLVGCLFIWLVINASISKKWPWMFAAGSAAAVALLVKPEFGLACYGTLALLVALRAFYQKSWRVMARDVSTILPGIALCGLVIRWMVSIAGAAFITQENILSWPTSFFMKNYSKAWLAQNGFRVTGSDFISALLRAGPIAAVLLASYVLLRPRRYGKRLAFMMGLLVLALILYFVKNNYFVSSVRQSVTLLFSTIFLPKDMVLYIIVAVMVVWCYLLWRPAAARNFAFPLVLTFSSALAFRILMKMDVSGYAIYYNGPVVLSFLLLLRLIIPRSNGSGRFVFMSECVLCLTFLTPVVLKTLAVEAQAADFVPLTTSRGTIRVPKHMAENYSAAIQFMTDKAALGQQVLSVPEDNSLYFLSETECATRLYAFVPGVLAPGKMTDDTIRQIERQPVAYLLWSNRTFPEYGAPIFGLSFDRTLGDYLKSHYRSVGLIIPNTGNYWDWTAVVWEQGTIRLCATSDIEDCPHHMWKDFFQVAPDGTGL
jgi:hypothetical protein